jgi:hypothetical protein
MGYLAMNPVWDVRGLVTPPVADLLRDANGDCGAVVDDLLRVRPIYVQLPARKAGMREPYQRLARCLSGDPRVARAYERVVDPERGTVLFVRREPARRPGPERVRRALERFPEYDGHRAR